MQHEKLPFNFLNKSVFVLGSAPNPVPPPEAGHGWVSMTVNGSQASLANLGLDSMPNATIFNTSLIKTNYAPNAAARHVLRGKRTENLIVLSESNSLRKRIHVILRLLILQYKYKTLTILTTHTRLKIIEETIQKKLLERKDQPSNGIFTALLALHLGAEKVLLSGFSLSKQGHAYNNLNFKRAHATGDLIVLERAVELGLPIYTTDRDFSTESGVPLI